MIFHNGQPFRPSASRENEIEKMLTDYRAGRLQYGANKTEPMPLGHMLAKNETGYDLGWGGVVIYPGDHGYKSKGPGGAYNGEWDMRKGYLSLKLAKTIVSDDSEPVGGIAITLEPIAQNQLGRVAVAGLCLVRSYPPHYPGYSSEFQWHRYLVPDTDNSSEWSYWGFGRALSWSAGLSVVDLSDRKLQTAYVLKANMANGKANALLGVESRQTWMTTVYDPFNIAKFQKAEDKGFCEWQGFRWVVTTAYCKDE